MWQNRAAPFVAVIALVAACGAPPEPRFAARIDIARPASESAAAGEKPLEHASEDAAARVRGPLRERIGVLVDEMLAGREPAEGRGGLHGAAMLYAHAFAAYALVDVGLGSDDDAAWAKPRLNLLIDRTLHPALGAAFDAGQVRVQGHVLSASVALRGHLALMLVGLRALGPTSADREALARALMRGLAADFASDPAGKHLLPTYGRKVWPADNEVAAAALEIYLTVAERDEDILRGATALRRALDALEKDGLPPSAVASGGLAGIDVPRGCALSWTVAMRGLYDGRRAQSLYAHYRNDFFVDLGVVKAFREWPRGIDRKPDADSGPILLGIGVSASGIGIGAAKLAGSNEDADALERSAELAGLGLIESTESNRWLERAMAAWARTARPWR